MNIVNTTYISTEDMINKLQELKGKTKLKFYKNISNFYDEMKHKNFQAQEDLFSKNGQCICETYHEVLILMKNLQAKSQENMNINCYDFYHTVIKNRKQKDNDEEQYENDYIIFNDFITADHYIRIKNDNVILS